MTEESAQGFEGIIRISSGRRSLRSTWLLLNRKSTEAHPFGTPRGLAHLLKPNDLYYSTMRSIKLTKKCQGYCDGWRKSKVRGGHGKGPTGQQQDGCCILGAQPPLYHQDSVPLTHQHCHTTQEGICWAPSDTGHVVSVICNSIVVTSKEKSLSLTESATF